METVVQSSRNSDFEKDAHSLALGIPAVHFAVFPHFFFAVKVMLLIFRVPRCWTDWVLVGGVAGAKQ